MEDSIEQRERPADANSKMTILKLGAVHLAAWVGAMSLFAAADSWYHLTQWPLATLLTVFTGIIAGFVTVTLFHEWFHFLGARLSGGAYTVASTTRIFIFDWNFAANSVRQFYIMSIGGTVGGFLALILLWQAVTPDTAGRSAIVAAAAGGFVFASIIEWPVLRRVSRSGKPLEELSKIDGKAFTRATVGAIIAGLLLWWVIAG